MDVQGAIFRESLPGLLGYDPSVDPVDAYRVNAGDIPAAQSIIRDQLADGIANDIAAGNLVDLALGALPSFPPASEILESESAGGGGGGGIGGWLEHLKSMFEAE